MTRAGSPPSALLVFVTAVPISNFVRAARLVGLEVLAELDLDDDYALDEALLAPHREMASPTLYATMPTRESFERLLGLWRAYQRGERSARKAMHRGQGSSRCWTICVRGVRRIGSRPKPA